MLGAYAHAGITEEVSHLRGRALDDARRVPQLLDVERLDLITLLE